MRVQYEPAVNFDGDLRSGAGAVLLVLVIRLASRTCRACFLPRHTPETLKQLWRSHSASSSLGHRRLWLGASVLICRPRFDASSLSSLHGPCSQIRQLTLSLWRHRK